MCFLQRVKYCDSGDRKEGTLLSPRNGNHYSPGLDVKVCSLSVTRAPFSVSAAFSRLLVFICSRMKKRLAHVRLGHSVLVAIVCI